MFPGVYVRHPGLKETRDTWKSILNTDKENKTISVMHSQRVSSDILVK